MAWIRAMELVDMIWPTFSVKSLWLHPIIPSIPLYHHVICFKGLPSGKPTVRYGKSPLFIYIYKYQLFQWPFSSSQTVTNYKRVIPWFIMVFRTAGWWSHIPLYHKWTTNGPPLYHHCTTIVPFLLYHINIHKPSSLGLFHFTSSQWLPGHSVALLLLCQSQVFRDMRPTMGIQCGGPQTIATLVYD